MTATTRVLHIEADDGRAEQIAHELNPGTGHRVARALDHGEGIRMLLDEGPYDAVIVDVDPHRPDVATVIRDLDVHAAHTAIVATSSQPSPPLDQDCLRAGAADVVGHDYLHHHVIERVIRHAIARNHRLEQIRSLSTTDDLTEIGNRRALHNWYRAATSRLERHGGQIVVAMLDIDQFKTVNDTLGHAKGDELLRDVAHRLVAAFRPDDAAARIGGDEFALVVHTAEADGHNIIAGRVDQALTVEPLRIDGHPVTISAGYAATTDPTVDLPNLLARSDTAMYQQKRSHER